MADESFGSEFSSGQYPQIPKDVLQDLCSRFLINIPENEKNDMVRICFQIELAHWYYIDFCRQDNTELPVCGMKAFMSIIFTEFQFLNKSKQSVQTIFDNWKKYKVRVPVFGAILLDESLEKCLLVQGFHSKTSWGFPKGKINKDEGDLDCAIREVYEEVGYDITPLAHSNQFLENNIHDHQVRLYIVAGVDEFYNFKPNTRGEIKAIRWFNVSHLPTHKKDMTPKEEIGLNANNFFMIHTFIKPLRKWISDKKKSMSSLAMSSSLGMLYQHTSQHYHQAKDGSPRSDEHKELIKQRKLREAEEYKNMHVLMNPLLSQRSNEEMLKGMLGMASAQSQPEAIQRLLTGTVNMSPVATPERRSKTNFSPMSSKGQAYSAQRASPSEFASPHSNKEHRKDNDEHSRYHKKDQNRHSRSAAESYAQKASRNTGYQKDSPSRSQQNVYTYHSPKNSPASTPSRKLLYSTEQNMGGKNRSNSKTNIKTKPGGLSDFRFDSSAFLNFKFNYDEILASLT